MKEYANSRSYWNEYFKQYLTAAAGEQSSEEENDSLGCTDVENTLKAISVQGKVLDFGCGSGWASEYMALNGEAHMTAIDYAESAIQAAKEFAAKQEIGEKVDFIWVDSDWIHTQDDDTYDAFFSSNVFDVIAEDVTRDTFLELKRILKQDAKLVICLNAYFSDEMCKKHGLVESSTPRHYLEGDVLRLVCRTDEEWKTILEEYFTVEELKIFRYDGEPEANKRRMFLLTNRK